MQNTAIETPLYFNSNHPLSCDAGYHRHPDSSSSSWDLNTTVMATCKRQLTANMINSYHTVIMCQAVTCKQFHTQTSKHSKQRA